MLQRAVRLEKMQQVEFLVDPYGLYGAVPTVVPDGEVDDDLGNISPLSIAIKKNNYEMWALLRYHMGDATDLQYLEPFQLLEYQWGEGRFDTLGLLGSAHRAQGQHPC